MSIVVFVILSIIGDFGEWATDTCDMYRLYFKGEAKRCHRCGLLALVNPCQICNKGKRRKDQIFYDPFPPYYRK